MMREASIWERASQHLLYYPPFFNALYLSTKER